MLAISVNLTPKLFCRGRLNTNVLTDIDKHLGNKSEGNVHRFILRVSSVIIVWVLHQTFLVGNYVYRRDNGLLLMANNR